MKFIKRLTLASFPVLIPFSFLNRVNYKSSVGDLLIVILIIIGSNKMVTSDLMVYQEFYINPTVTSIKEPIFYLIAFIFSSFGIGFKFFMIFYLCLSYSLIDRFINKLGLYKWQGISFLVSTLFFIEIFEQSAHLLRQFLGGAFLLNAIVEKKKEKIFFFFLQY